MADAEFARFETMTNVELRAELKRRGCPTSGNKKDLLAKLYAALQKEHEQNIPQSISYPMVASPEEKQIRTRSKNLSVDSRTDNNEDIVLDNTNNNEMDTFVSKNKEEEEKNSENIGGDIDLTSIGSEENAKLESIIKEIPLSDEQQHLNQSETIHPTIDILNDDTKNQENEIIDLSSKPVEEQPEIPKEIKPTRTQISSLIKIPNRSTVNKINLSSELLKTLITDLTLASESILYDELDNESVIDNDIASSDSLTIGDLADQKQPTNRTVAIDDLNTRKNSNSMPIRLPSFEPKDGKNSLVTDEPIRIKDVTKGFEPTSQILYIRGLTRPFSLMQLKELLSRYGTLVIGEFWLDKIKSQCFVTYNTIEEAQNARDGLDGCRWPSTNPKTLSVRFGQQDELDFSKTHDLPPDQISENKNSEDRVVEERASSPVNGIQSKNHVDEPKQSGFLITEEDEEPVKTNEQPGKGLDDYFRKTKAKPSIYWLPLTEEEIIERTRRQKERNAERDEERRKREVNENTRRSSEKRRRSSSFSSRNSKRH